MKKILLALVALFSILAATPSFAQFNPSNGFQTINNTCGTYFLQGTTYYNYQGVSIGSTLPVCVPPFTIQNSSAALIIPAKFATANLPACSAATTGLEAITTDGTNSPTYNATATSGGAGGYTVVCNGTNWTNH